MLSGTVNGQNGAEAQQGRTKISLHACTVLNMLQQVRYQVNRWTPPIHLTAPVASKVINCFSIGLHYLLDS